MLCFGQACKNKPGTAFCSSLFCISAPGHSVNPNTRSKAETLQKCYELACIKLQLSPQIIVVCRKLGHLGIRQTQGLWLLGGIAQGSKELRKDAGVV